MHEEDTKGMDGIIKNRISSMADTMAEFDTHKMQWKVKKAKYCVQHYIKKTDEKRVWT